MNPKQPRSRLDEHLVQPVIPYVSERPGDHVAVLARASLIMLQADELADLPAILELFKQPPLRGIHLMLHLDLVRGLAKDEAGVRYVAGLERVNGIITVHHHLVATARRLGLTTIVRLFLQDGRAVNRGLAVVEKSRPDAVELLPGVAAIEVAKDFEAVSVPRIAGGLIRGAETLQRVMASGVRSVSTTNHTLWSLNAG
jgi:glycerol uptake operon antiterminator